LPLVARKGNLAEAEKRAARGGGGGGLVGREKCGNGDGTAGRGPL